MNLFSDVFFKETEKKRNRLLAVFIVLCILCAALYTGSFFFGNLYISLAVGICSVVFLVLFFYGLIYEKNKLLKLNKSLISGITQSNTYTFERLDGFTEHDGVKLLRLICSFTDEGEVFERTLYFLCALPYPELKQGQQLTVTTHRNIIVNIDIKD